MPDPQLILALDFGGTKNSAAIVGAGENEWRGLARRSSGPHPTQASDWATMLSMARELLGGARPAAIGVSFGGPVYASRGVVRLSDHVPGWGDFPLATRLEEEFGAATAVDNDANIAALGEARFGAGRGASSVFYVTVSTGVGGGLVIDGQVYHGYDEMAGEIGHMLVDPTGPLCTCGRRGCVEVMACGPSIASFARERLIADPSRGRILREWVSRRLDEITAQTVNEAALAGDDLAREVMDNAARALGLGLGSAIVLFNPEKVVIGGGVSKSGEHYFGVVRAAARGNCRAEMTVDIVPAALGDDAPLWGAVALARDLLG